MLASEDSQEKKKRLVNFLDFMKGRIGKGEGGKKVEDKKKKAC